MVVALRPFLVVIPNDLRAASSRSTPGLHFTNTGIRASFIPRLQLPLLIEESRISDLSWGATAGWRAQVDDRPIGKFGNLSRIVEVIVFAECVVPLFCDQ